MGEVYRAEDLTLQQEVALKFLPAELTGDPAALERFHREVRIARQVSHPNVCRVFDIGTAEGAPFLTMEYVDGEDLGVLLRRIGRFPEDKGLEIARQICAGLAAAHEQGLLHRDLKPANVMLDGRGRVRISDFGLASIAGDVHGADVRAGTPAYMAPEQLAGAGVTQKSDIYSLGLVLYEIFTGKRAYDAQTIAELNRVRESSAPASPSTLVKDLDPIIERVISRCLEKDPKNRPATALQVAAALPGGDPLAAALAAGETPSPEMVAAAGSKEGMRPMHAWICLALIAAGLAYQIGLNGYSRLYRTVDLSKSPEVLEDRAKQLVQEFGYTATPKSKAAGFDLDGDYLDYVEKNDKSKTRWNHVPSAVQFWYRQSPDIFLPLQILADNTSIGRVKSFDPPVEDPGEILLKLDPQGHLNYLRVIPPRASTAKESTPRSADWNRVLSEAGLVPAQCKPADPRWNPLSFADALVAWTAPMPERPDLTLHIEGASYQGQPVYFRMDGPWVEVPVPGGSPASSDNSGLVDQVFTISILLSVLVAGLVLARRNLRLGRSDLRGSWRLAGFVFCVSLVGWVIGANHISGPLEAYVFVLELAWASLASLFLWMLYVAMEPFVRRRMPKLLVSWSRLLAGQFRDPMIGRDILVGAAVGLMGGVIDYFPYIWNWLRGLPPVQPTGDGFGELAKVQYAFADFLSSLNNALFNSLAILFLLIILKIMVRKSWAAGVLLVAIFTLRAVLQHNSSINAYVTTPLGFGLFAFLILRYGILATTVGLIVQALLHAPFTTQGSAWYAWIGWFCLAIFAGLVFYGLRNALAGQSLFSPRLIADD